MEMRSVTWAALFSRIRVGSLALVGLLLFAAPFAQAAPLTAVPPGFLSPVPVETDPAAGSTLIAGGTSEAFSGFGFSGVLVSSVFRGNSFGPDALTFTYRLSNDAASFNALHRMTISSFATFLSDVSTQAGGVQPTIADRSTPDVIGFSFLDGLGGQGPVRPNGQSSLMVIETNSLAFTPSTASIIDGSIAGVPSFAPLPAIPEPGTLALGVIGSLGFIGLIRRVRR
ncbi:MAG: hypothetical protein WD894_12430 [Pirellulales bacterium]